MSSDGYFEGDDFDPSLLNELDAIEARHFSPSRNTTQPAHIDPPATPLVSTRAAPLARADTSDFFDDSFAIDDAEFQRLDTFIEDAYQGKAGPVAGPSTVSRSASKVQMTLFGDVLPQEASSSKAKATPSRGLTKQPSVKRSQFGQQAPKTKTWDRTAFAKSGWKKQPKGKGKDKGKGKGSFDGDEDDVEDEEEADFEQFPAPFVSLGPPPPMKLEADLLEAKHWIYPLNKPKRDYQFNIVKHSLFENTLVALPTGLGKTFVAGVVMLNFYRWFPEGKVIFVAPTKPLVAQQVDACHKSCGIPGRDAAELTGEIQRGRRAKLWQEKRVFFMTPQTLINDLATGICDPLEVILIVVDEAHKATGDYSYSQVLRFMMAKNPHFRVLALSATPGSDPQKVQDIIDNLHISRIEIRDETSMDIREYVFKKEIKQHIIGMNDEVNKIKDLLVKVMENTLKPLVNRGIFEHLDVVKMHPYRAQAKQQEIQGKKQDLWALTPLSKLGFLARAMGYLFEASVKMCHQALQQVVDEKGDEGKSSSSKKTMGKQLRADPSFGALMKEIDGQMNRMGGYGPHPKMAALKMLMLQHFATRTEDEDGQEDDTEDKQAPGETRAMVFVTNRGCVDEVVQWLNEESPMLKAVSFVGQGTDKQGKKGYTQKQQLDVINQFKAGTFNVLVCTSIGEEGLDIGEVDLIVCYDAQKAPIRMLQRIGRTGRKRTGYVHVLLSEIREEANWEKAKDTYGEVQKSIVRGDQLELYGDVERLLPDHMKPQCLEKKMDIEEYIREEKTKGGKKDAAGPSKEGTAAAKKRKRDAEDMGRNIPDGAFAGFVKASALKKRKKTKVPEFDPLAGEDDDTDREIEAGLEGPRRTASTPAAATKIKKKSKKTLRKAKTMGGTEEDTKEKKKKKKSTKTHDPTPPTASQFLQMGVDDSDDMEIEMGITPSVPQLDEQPRINSPQPQPQQSKFPKYWSSSPAPLTLHDDSVVEIPNPSIPHATSHPSRRRRTIAPTKCPESPKYWTSSLEVPIADDVISIPSSPASLPHISPAPSWTKPSSIHHGSHDRPTHFKPGQSSGSSPSPPREGYEEDSLAWLLDEDEDPEIEILDSSPLHGRHPSPAQVELSIDDSVEIVDNYLPVKRRSRFQPDDTVEIVEPMSVQRSIGPLHTYPQGTSLKGKERNFDMAPPEVPRRLVGVSPMALSDQDYPEASFAVRPAGKRSKKRVAVIEPESPLLSMPLPQRRLHRKRSEASPSPPPRPSKSKRRKEDPRVVSQWILTEATHSGDEVSEGSSCENDVETEFDKQFLQELPATQASPSYNQTLAYRQSLFSQGPTRSGPVFANRPVPRGGARFAGGAKGRPVVSSSPPREDDGPDEYALGSFVVDDDAEITYASSDI